MIDMYGDLRRPRITTRTRKQDGESEKETRESYEKQKRE
jgi:hypothetical protein